MSALADRLENQIILFHPKISHVPNNATCDANQEWRQDTDLLLIYDSIQGLQNLMFFFNFLHLNFNLNKDPG